MFGGVAYEQHAGSGKRISGFTSQSSLNLGRKEPAFRLGWDQPNLLNTYQLRKGMGQEVTGKITGSRMQKQPEQADLPAEELHKYMNDYSLEKRPSIKNFEQANVYSYERREPVRQK